VRPAKDFDGGYAAIYFLPKSMVGEAIRLFAAGRAS